MPLSIDSCTEHCLRLWEVAGTWISGLGTLSAAGIALWLGLAEHRPRLRCLARIGVPIGGAFNQVGDRHLWISVTNVGRRPAVLQSVGWESGLFWQDSPFLPKQFAFLVAEGPYCRPLPSTLQPGETASFMTPLGTSVQSVIPMVTQPFWLAIRFLNVMAYDSLGGRHCASMSKDLRAEILLKVQSPVANSL